MISTRRGFLSAVLAAAGVSIVGIRSAEPRLVTHPVGYVIPHPQGIWVWHCAWCKSQAHGRAYGLRGLVDTTIDPGHIYGIKRTLTESDTVQYYRDTRPWTWRQWTKRYARG